MKTDVTPIDLHAITSAVDKIETALRHIEDAQATITELSGVLPGLKKQLDDVYRVEKLQQLARAHVVTKDIGFGLHQYVEDFYFPESATDAQAGRAETIHLLVERLDALLKILSPVPRNEPCFVERISG